MAEVLRSSLSITVSVWRALLLREALTRISGARAPWLWLLLEPMMHMFFLVSMMTIIRQRVIGGIDTALFIVSGLLAFFFFRRTATQATNAVNANRSLFAYRQVLPVDTCLVRSFLEGGLMLLVSLLIFSAMGLFGKTIWPHDPMFLLSAILGLWLLGLGWGLIFSVVTELIPEVQHIVSLAMMPLYLLSGVLLPVAMVPMPYRNWLLYNPIVHGLEATRLAFASYYHAVPELDLSYLYTCAFVLLFFGLALHKRFYQRLVAQ